MSESAISVGGEIYGPMLIGTLLNCILYGATLVQAYVYFQTYKGDKRWMKMFVFYMLFFETLNTTCDVGVIYEPLILRFGSPHVLEVAPIMLATNPALTVMVSLPVQLFIAWRVKKMNKSIVLPVIISLLALSSFVGGILISVLLARIDFKYSEFHRNDAGVVLWLGSTAATDTVITASLVYSLWRKRTGFAVTDNIINRIVRMTVQTGLMTAMFAILDVSLFMLARRKTWNFIWDIPLSKLYTNTLLSTLNARQGWKSTGAVQANLLFSTVGGLESTAKSRSQIEFGSGELPIRHLPSAIPVPMKVLDSGAGKGYDNADSNSVVKIVHEYPHAI